MTKGKTELKERKFSLLVLFFTVITIAVAFLAEYYFLAPKGLMGMSSFALGICFFLMIYFWREEGSVFWSLYLIGAGSLIGGVLNISFSTEFLSEPSIVFLIVNSFIVCILLLASFTLRKDISWVKKSGFVFLGCWIISVVLLSWVLLTFLWSGYPSFH